MAKVDLEFLARQFERVISDLATLKDDGMVVMARLDRIDATVQSLVVEVQSDAQPPRTSRAPGRAPRGAGAVRWLKSGEDPRPSSAAR